MNTVSMFPNIWLLMEFGLHLVYRLLQTLNDYKVLSLSAPFDLLLHYPYIGSSTCTDVVWRAAPVILQHKDDSTDNMKNI